MISVAIDLDTVLNTLYLEGKLRVSDWRDIGRYFKG
jgi:hypothetical protein